MDKTKEKDQLYYAMKLFLKGEYPVKDFCSNFERIFNLELDKKILSDKELSVFKELFDKVAHFNEFPEDRNKWPGFTNENDIQLAVKEAAKKLDLP